MRGLGKRGPVSAVFSREEIILCIERIKKEHNVTDTEIASCLFVRDIEIPVSIFNNKISSLEAICKYLIENRNLSIRDTAALLNRDRATVYQAYADSKNKHPHVLEVKQNISFPALILQDRRFSVLESIVLYLKEKIGFSNHRIAAFLHRNDKTIWTVYHRALPKKYGR